MEQTKLEIVIDVIKTYIDLAKHFNSQGENSKALQYANPAIKAVKGLREQSDSEEVANCLILAYDAVLLGDFSEETKESYRIDYVNFIETLKTHLECEVKRYAEISADIIVGSSDEEVADFLKKIDEISSEVDEIEQSLNPNKRK